MGRVDYVQCRECGGFVSEVGVLSHTRLCAACGEKLLRANTDGIHYRSGVAYQRWRLGQVARLLPDDVVAALYRAGEFAA